MRNEKCAASAIAALRALSLTLLEGARECLELARDCISRGDDPRPSLRWAMTRIRKLPRGARVAR